MSGAEENMRWEEGRMNVSADTEFFSAPWIFAGYPRPETRIPQTHDQITCHLRRSRVRARRGPAEPETMQVDSVTQRMAVDGAEDGVDVAVSVRERALLCECCAKSRVLIDPPASGRRCWLLGEMSVRLKRRIVASARFTFYAGGVSWCYVSLSTWVLYIRILNCPAVYM